jgi:hypothetical protein
MEDRRRRIITIIIIILGFLRGNVGDSALNITMHNQLWTVYGLAGGTVPPSTAITKAADDLCNAVYNGTGDLSALSDALAAVLP